MKDQLSLNAQKRQAAQLDKFKALFYELEARLDKGGTICMWREDDEYRVRYGIEDSATRSDNQNIEDALRDIIEKGDPPW